MVATFVFVAFTNCIECAPFTNFCARQAHELDEEKPDKYHDNYLLSIMCQQYNN